MLSIEPLRPVRRARLPNPSLYHLMSCSSQNPNKPMSKIIQSTHNETKYMETRNKRAFAAKCYLPRRCSSRGIHHPKHSSRVASSRQARLAKANTLKDLLVSILVVSTTDVARPAVVLRNEGVERHATCLLPSGFLGGRDIRLRQGCASLIHPTLCNTETDTGRHLASQEEVDA